MEIPSTCPECGRLLDHRKRAPGGIDAPIEVTCPDCGYEKTLAET